MKFARSLLLPVAVLTRLAGAAQAQVYRVVGLSEIDDFILQAASELKKLEAA